MAGRGVVVVVQRVAQLPGGVVEPAAHPEVHRGLAQGGPAPVERVVVAGEVKGPAGGAGAARDAVVGVEADRVEHPGPDGEEPVARVATDVLVQRQDVLGEVCQEKISCHV